jgi:hypothetical protein
MFSHTFIVYSKVPGSKTIVPIHVCLSSMDPSVNSCFLLGENNCPILVFWDYTSNETPIMSDEESIIY